MQETGEEADVISGVIYITQVSNKIEIYLRHE